MKRWLITVIVLGSVTLAVAWIARSRQGPDRVPPVAAPTITKPASLPAPLVTDTNPSTGVRVAELLERLSEAIQNYDPNGESRIQAELQAMGFPVVEPLRVDLLDDPQGFHRDRRFQKSVVGILMGLASPETGIELLETWSEVDRSKYRMSLPPALFILGQYAPVVATKPSNDLAKRVLEQFSKAKIREIRLSLVELMGLLLSRFPNLRDELLRIMREDADKEVRAKAVLALATHEPALSLPAIMERLEALVQAEGRTDSTKELMCLVEFLVKALPLDQVLDRLKGAGEKATGVYAVNLLNTLGLSLGTACGEAGTSGFEILMTRAAAEKSTNMQLIYLGALGGAALKENKDPRATDLALGYLESSKDEWVQSWALSMITGLNRDEPTVLGAIEHAIKGGGALASTGGMQLAFYYYVKNPSSAAALEMIRRHVTTGDKESRLTILKRLCVSSTPMPPTIREMVTTVSESDPDPDIRALAAKVLNWTGGPPPR